MFKKIVYGAIFMAMVFGNTPVSAMTIQELRANIDRDLKAEIFKMPLSELYSMQEVGFPTEKTEEATRARNQEERINSMPDFARRALYGNVKTAVIFLILPKLNLSTN